jgi:DNA-binding NarL/FixJ family response regulator
MSSSPWGQMLGDMPTATGTYNSIVKTIGLQPPNPIRIPRMRDRGTPTPWHLTKAEQLVLDTLVETGCNRATAAKLKLRTSTVENHVRKCCQRMQVPNRIMAVVAWDRFKRTQ